MSEGESGDSPLSVDINMDSDFKYCYFVLDGIRVFRECY